MNRPRIKSLVVSVATMLVLTALVVASKDDRPRVSGEGLVLIQPGSFMMGAAPRERGRAATELQQEVELSHAFYMQATEVTQGQWRRVMGNSPSYFESCGDDCPVDRVSWFDALAYANALSRLQGLEQCYHLLGCRGVPGGGCRAGTDSCRGGYQCLSVELRSPDCNGYRLPTEAEWEYAARAGTTSAHYGGGTVPPDCAFSEALTRVAWYCGNSHVEYEPCIDLGRAGGSSCSGPRPVGWKAPNDWGLYDMIGNLWEWVWDRHIPQRDDLLGEASTQDRVFRGGAWASATHDCRAAARYGIWPSFRSNHIGFRLVRLAVD